VRCAAITRAGERCKLDATSGSYCWSHAPENAEARRQRARRGGKARGSSEVSAIKRELRTVIADVLSGQIKSGVGAVAFQGYNALLRACEIERKLIEQEEIITRLEQLEQQARLRTQGYSEGSRGSWG
jgi:hypothetical protein